MGDAGASERPAWCDALKGLAPADALEAVATPALPEDKGEGRMRRILAAAFVSLEPFEKASGHATAMVFVLIMLSPHGSNIFDLVGHALKASSSVGIPPGVKSVGRNLFGRAHELFVAEVGAAPKAETQEEKAGRLEAPQYQRYTDTDPLYELWCPSPLNHNCCVTSPQPLTSSPCCHCDTAQM